MKDRTESSIKDLIYKLSDEELNEIDDYLEKQIIRERINRIKEIEGNIKCNENSISESNKRLTLLKSK